MPWNKHPFIPLWFKSKHKIHVNWHFWQMSNQKFSKSKVPKTKWSQKSRKVLLRGERLHFLISWGNFIPLKKTLLCLICEGERKVECIFFCLKNGEFHAYCLPKDFRKVSYLFWPIAFPDNMEHSPSWTHKMTII